MQVVHFEFVTETQQHCVEVDAVTFFKPIVELLILIVEVSRNAEDEVCEDGRLRRLHLHEN